MRGMKGLTGGNKRSRPKVLPPKGRNVEFVGYVLVERNGERMLRCRACDAVVPVNGAWSHGTSDDPHTVKEGP